MKNLTIRNIEKIEEPLKIIERVERNENKGRDRNKIVSIEE